ncbi:MAG: 3-hydroxyacyl-CoA dehydrogenase NAD-binding domain-containing protein [Bacteroidota bacterium]|nr:3-hydroxyacyl-CoA dehydrogenase NAD-binding domain-containing protein [Bacteroidota bacterium]
MKVWNQVGIVGAGTMGSGIAQIAAQAGCQVVLVDASEDALARSENNLNKVFSRLVEKGRLTEVESDQIKGRIHRTTSIDALATAELVIEAIVEDLGVKTELFQRLEHIVGKNTVLATNTSSLSVTALAKGCQRPEQVIGLHFFNPAPLMALVEVIPALQTQSGLAEQAMSAMVAWGKSPALATDTPGFIVNRVARPFYSEALRILEEGIASVEDIDASMRAKGFRMGPFELMDLIGHDVNYKVTSTVHEAFFGDTRYRPSHTQRQLVAAHWLGRKTGRGFYTYGESKEATPSGVAVEGVSERILAMLMNEAADAVFWQVGSAEAIDLAMQNGVNYPKGLLAWADEWGVQEVINVLESLRQRYGEERYRVSPLLRDMARTKQTFFN